MSDANSWPYGNPESSRRAAGIRAAARGRGWDLADELEASLRERAHLATQLVDASRARNLAATLAFIAGAIAGVAATVAAIAL